MRWRRAALGGGTALGAAAAYNAFAARGVERLPNLLGGDERWFHWRGHRVAYTVHGDGPPLLLVHGIHAAAWSYEWRAAVDVLAARYAVHAIDLLGFGRSARPAIEYSARLYTSLIADFAAQVVHHPCVLVASSLAGAYAIAIGARDPGRFPALVLVEPTGLGQLDRPPTWRDEASRRLLRTPLIGTALFNLLVSRGSLRHFLKQAYADDSAVTETLVDLHYAAAHQPGARFAPAGFIGQRLNLDIRRALRRLRQPTLLVWGERAVISPVEQARAFQVAKPDIELAILDAGSLPHDERPAEFNEALLGFLDRVAEMRPATRRMAV